MDPLHERSTNTTTSPTKSSSTLKMSDSTATSEQPNKGLEYHRQLLQSKLEENKDQKTYISPSDTIMSPTTKKLSDLKGKRFGAGAGKGQSLFAKAVANRTPSPEKSSKAFEDVKPS